MRMIQLATTHALLLLVCLSPASAQSVRIFHGGVVNQGLRTQPGSLVIALIDEPGSRLGGAMSLGEPLNGGGPITGRRSGDSLVIITQSTSGDTIVRLSLTNNQFIGGPYEVVGGPYRGQTGVWTASMHLMLHSTKRTERVPIEVVDDTQGVVGRALVYSVREALKKSGSFRVTDIREPRYQLIVAAMPKFESDPDVSTLYVTILTFISGTESAGWRNHFLDRQLGYTGVDVAPRTADILVDRVDRVMGNALREVMAVLR